MEGIVNLLSFNGFGGFSSGDPLSSAMPLILSLCVLGTVLVTSIIGRNSTFEYVFTFTGLTAGAIVFCRVLKDVHLPAADEMTHIIAFTIAGMSAASILIMLYFRQLRD